MTNCSLQWIQDNIQATIISGFIVVVAIAYIVIGCRATSKAKQLRAEQFPKRTLRKKFNEVDGDKDGEIKVKEFYELLSTLGVDISYQGAEMIFMSLDRNMNGNINFDEFEKFWSSEDPLTMIPA